MPTAFSPVEDDLIDSSTGGICTNRGAEGSGSFAGVLAQCRALAYLNLSYIVKRLEVKEQRACRSAMQSGRRCRSKKAAARSAATVPSAVVPAIRSGSEGEGRLV